MLSLSMKWSLTISCISCLVNVVINLEVNQFYQISVKDLNIILEFQQLSNTIQYSVDQHSCPAVHLHPLPPLPLHLLLSRIAVTHHCSPQLHHRAPPDLHLPRKLSSGGSLISVLPPDLPTSTLPSWPPPLHHPPGGAHHHGLHPPAQGGCSI